MVTVVDLFCGMGGFSYGFSVNNFQVIGYDNEKICSSIYYKNKLGDVIVEDLSNKSLSLEADVIIGGPPCRPWSSVNITKRGENHPDYGLVNSFFNTVKKSSPEIFLMENVLPLKNDIIYQKNIKKISSLYNIDSTIISYDRFGAASKRNRFITFGFKEKNKLDEFKKKIDSYFYYPSTVGDRIKRFQQYSKGEFPDHVWPNFTTIHKYQKYYETGKYGWYILNMNDQAPSFGNVMKTYTLHPSQERVVSVREVMSIMGFPLWFSFPEDMGHTKKYQMVADVVSPYFSRICAHYIKRLLNN